MSDLDEILKEARRAIALTPERQISPELRAEIAKIPRLERVEEIIAAIDWKIDELTKWRRELEEESRKLREGSK